MDFEWKHQVRWSDVDANRHMRNTAFSEVAIDARLQYMAGAGFPTHEFERIGFGPVIIREDIRYRREVFFDDVLSVRLFSSGLSVDASHWRIHHEVRRPDGKIAATLSVTGGWIDLRARKLRLPSEAAADVLRRLERTPDFEELPSLVPRNIDSLEAPEPSP